MIDLQALMNHTQDMLRESRSSYHLTLGQLIRRLEKLPQHLQIRTEDDRGIEGLCSYRGYYCDLSLNPVDGPVWTAGFLLRECRRVLDTNPGFKGGEFLMDRYTPLWLSEHGSTREEAIMDLLHTGVLVTRNLGQPEF